MSGQRKKPNEAKSLRQILVLDPLVQDWIHQHSHLPHKRVPLLQHQPHRHLCVQSDDMDYIYEEFRKSEIVVFATPLFFWSYSGLIKNAIDRMWALAEGEVDELHGNNKSGILLIAAGGCHPELLIEHFNYLMQRLKKHGSSYKVLRAKK